MIDSRTFGSPKFVTCSGEEQQGFDTYLVTGEIIRVPTANPPPTPSSRGKTSRNHLNEEISPLFPTGIGERSSQTISNLGDAALWRRCELLLP